jgi:hypothetical protein
MVLNKSAEADSDLLNMNKVAEALPEMDAKKEPTVVADKINVNDGT